MGIRLDSIDINLGIFKFGLKIDDVKATLESLVEEMTTLTHKMSAEDRDLLEKIMAAESCSLRVSDLCEAFVRDSSFHDSLRSLREAQFIRPAVGGRWRGNSIIQIKPFGAIMWKEVGPKKLFA